MCIVAREVRLSNTSIFTFISKCGKAADGATVPERQLVMYQNRVNATPNSPAGENLMCLPIPLEDGLDAEREIILYNFCSEDKPAALQEAYKKFFADLKYAHKNPNTAKKSRSKSKGSPRGALAVVEVGNYLCSIARTAADIQRLDPEVFTTPTGIIEVLDKNYPKNFAFLLCKFNLEKAGKELHPIVYSHPVSKDGSLFIPTRHYHGSGEPNPVFADDWDHEIFIWGSTPEILDSFVSNSKFKQTDEAKEKSRARKKSAKVTKAYNSLPPRVSQALEHLFATQGDKRDSFGPGSYHIDKAAMLEVQGKFDNVDVQPVIVC